VITIERFIKQNYKMIDAMEQEDNIELNKTNLSRKTRELYKLQNKIKKYENRLIKEGLKIIDGFSLKIKVYESSDEYVDINPIIERAQIKYPSLYSKYKFLKKKNPDKLSGLEVLVKN
jgi:hypothetical protein